MSSNCDYKIKYKVQYFIKIVFKLKNVHFLEAYVYHHCPFTSSKLNTVNPSAYYLTTTFLCVWSILQYTILVRTARKKKKKTQGNW